MSIGFHEIEIEDSKSYAKLLSVTKNWLYYKEKGWGPRTQFPVGEKVLNLMYSQVFQTWRTVKKNFFIADF